MKINSHNVINFYVHLFRLIVSILFMYLTETSRLPLPEAAKDFIQSAYTELGIPDQVESRLEEINRQISATGTYVHTRAGARARCTDGLAKQQPLYRKAVLENPQDTGCQGGRNGSGNF
jgi:transcription initiation factor TFIIIB Brf1 subunit/transcription initiation factor TFIIB